MYHMFIYEFNDYIVRQICKAYNQQGTNAILQLQTQNRPLLGEHRNTCQECFVSGVEMLHNESTNSTGNYDAMLVLEIIIMTSMLCKLLWCLPLKLITLLIIYPKIYKSCPTSLLSISIIYN